VGQPPEKPALKYSSHPTTTGSTQTPNRILAWLLANRFPVLLALLVGGHFAWYTYITWTQYRAHRIFLIDAGLFDFMVSGFRHGHGMRFPLVWDANVTMLADHFRPFFYGIGLLYLAVDHPMVLLTCFNAGLAFAAVPLALLARQVLKNPDLAIAVAALYLTNHFVRSIQLAVHAEALIPIGIFTLIYALQIRHGKLLWLAFLYLISQKEDVPLYTGAVAFTVFLEQLWRTNDSWLKRQAAMMLAASMLAFVIAFLTMRLAGSQRLADAGINAFDKFSSMGETPWQVALFVFSHPLTVLSRMMTWTLVHLFSAMAFVSILDPKRAWIVVAAASIFLLVEDQPVSTLSYYYSYAAISFVFVSGIYGLSRLIHCLTMFRNPSTVPWVLISAVLIIQIPMPTRTDGLYHRPFPPNPRSRALDHLLKNLPPEAPVAAGFDLYARVPNRPIKLPITADHLRIIDYVVIDRYGIIDTPRTEIPRIQAIINSDEFVLLGEASGFQILKRVRPPSPELYVENKY
jgi:uncharacterized membrane protein